MTSLLVSPPTPLRRGPLLSLAALFALAAAACSPTVTIEDGSRGEGGTDAPPGTDSPPSPGTGGDGSGGAPDSPPSTGSDSPPSTGSDFELTCPPVSGMCSSIEYPEGESCEECFCRCCNIEDLMTECEADPACMTYVECVIGCEGDSTCLAACDLPCPTGNEPVCYLTDCHNWVCAHACGGPYAP